MNFICRRGGLVALAIAALFAVGCGETVIDDAKTAATLEENLEKSVGQKVSSVDCPSGVKVEAGKTFECTVSLAGGKSETATLKIVNSDADVEVTDLQANK